jgi:PAS domain S-box-containing protein
LIWSRYTPINHGPFIAKYAIFGTGFWIFMVYSYVQVLVGIFFVIQAIVLSGRLYRWQATATLAIVLLAWLMSALSYVIDIRPLPGLELTPIALSVTVPIIAWSLYHLQRRDILPVAHDLVIEGMLDGVMVLDSQNRIIDINAAAEHITGHPRFKAIGLPVGEVWPEWLGQLERINAGTLSEMTVEQIGKRRTYDVRLSPLIDWHGQLVSQVIVLRDITERKRAEEETLRRKITEFGSFMNNIPDLAWVSDAESRFIAVNKAFANAVGMKPEFLINNTCEVCFGKEEGKKFRADDQKVMENREQVILEEKIMDSQKKEVWLETIKSPMFDGSGKVTGTVGIARDITERKQAREALQESEKKLRLLSSHLLSAQEIERKRISKELHDELGQDLIGLRLRLGAIRRKLKEDQIAFISECQSIQNDVDQIIENVRRLSKDLGPYTLEHLGLWEALRYLTGDFAKYCNVKNSFDILNGDKGLPQRTQLSIFRVFQEALTNIQKHAHASNVLIEISEKDDSFSFLIEDDGKGFDLTKVMEKNTIEKGQGLVIMEERIRMSGGTFDIWSQDDKGTRISFTVPVSIQGKKI